MCYIHEDEMEKQLKKDIELIRHKSKNEFQCLGYHKPLNATTEESFQIPTKLLHQINKLGLTFVNSYVIIDDLHRLAYLYNEDGSLTEKNFRKHVSVVRIDSDDKGNETLSLCIDHAKRSFVKLLPDDREYPIALKPTPKWQHPWHVIFHLLDVEAEYERRCIEYQGNMLFCGTLKLGNAIEEMKRKEVEWREDYLKDPLTFGPEFYANEYKVDIPFINSDKKITATVNTSRSNNIATLVFSTWNHVNLNIQGVSGMLNSIREDGTVQFQPCEAAGLNTTLMRGAERYNHVLSIQVDNWE